jgi:hypothetical protein
MDIIEKWADLSEHVRLAICTLVGISR